MSSLKVFFEQCGADGVVERNPVFALTTFKDGQLSETDKTIKVFERAFNRNVALLR